MQPCSGHGEVRHAEARREAECCKGQGKEAACAGVDEVAVIKNRGAETHARSLDAGHHGLGHRLQLRDEAAGRRVGRSARVFKLLLEVSARTEDAGLGRDDNHSHVVVSFGIGQKCGEFFQRFGVERIAFFRARDFNGENTLFKNLIQRHEKKSFRGLGVVLSVRSEFERINEH